MELLFADEGVTSSTTRKDFFDRMLKIPTTSITPQYLQKIRSNLWKYVVYPRIETPYHPVNWKNNGCESLNHMVKSEINFTPQSLEKLIDVLYQMGMRDINNIKAAFYNEGDFR